nr:ubiquitin-like-conjugating enzyme ATG10 [Nerophis lumbriciformis]
MGARLQGEENFHRCCQAFLKLSDQLRDGWTWESVKSSNEGYLRKTSLRSVSVHSGASWIPAADEETNEDFDHHCHEDAVSSQVIQYEYHILYSCSYMNPVLYFRAFTLEGRSLSLDQVCRSVHPHFRLRLQQSPLTTITQQEHPLLGQPFFMLHPCRTEEFMKPVVQIEKEQHSQVNYILTWLSSVGPLVGLDVSLKYPILQRQLSEPEECPEPFPPS